MSAKVNWVKLEEIGETRILDALRLALLGKSIAEIERETRIPTSSLYSIKKHGPYEHRNRQRRSVEK
jgi:hypothetical protein